MSIHRFAGGLVLLLLCNPFLRAAAEPAAAALRAQVAVATAAPRPLQHALNTLGTVAGDPDRLVSETRPYDVVILEVLVRAGQSVQRGTPLLRLKPAPGAQIASVQAQTTLDVARAALARSERLLQDHLGTQADVDMARKNLADARAAYEAQYSGLAGQGIVRASVDGTLSQLNAAEGQQISAGAALLQITPRRQQVIFLGIEPEDRAKVKPGQPVELVSVFDPGATLTSAVQEVHAVVNPATRLLDVVVPIPAQAANRWLPGMYLRGRIVLATENVLAIPRSAVLEDEKGAYVYCADHGTARKRYVQERFEAQGFVAIERGLQNGDRVVVTGNYELSDGMAIAVAPAQTRRGATP